ncbi:uncharacterized protein LOC107365659 [Tetranychus urticae]|uniref:Uncharacterized protein n=1 Tax=Tetranychus urticae TaxID=32264 RepID=T1KN48_TETUR|nr:uncharacterized protein LOC107365659 [Tetranychus urticae]
MAKQNKNSDKITFKVKHLDEYHEIVIDPNDDRYESKHQRQQIFEQLESITGVPSRYTVDVLIHVLRNRNLSVDTVRYPWSFSNQKAYVPDSLARYSALPDFYDLNIFDGERFYLIYDISYSHDVSKHLSMHYTLVDEGAVPDEGCSLRACQYQCSESYFKRLKDLICNNEMNAKITQLVQTQMESDWELDTIFREFNVKQHFSIKCDVVDRWSIAMNGHARRHDLYLRTRG